MQHDSPPPGDQITPALFPGDAQSAVEITGINPALRAEAATHGWRVLAILSALMGFASISTDLYLPAMPAMSMALGAAHGMVEWTVSAYLIGFSLGQLVWGPVSDRYGRRLPIALGLVLFIIGSAGCAMAGNIWSMIGFRVVQAVGACANVVLARAMVRDLYSGDKAAQMMAKLMTVMAIAPLLGPLVGGQILVYGGWRAIFWVLVGVALLTLMALIRFPETLPTERRNRAPLSHIFANYNDLLRQRRVLSYAAVGGFYYAGLFAHLAGTPFAYISYHGVSPEHYGLLFAVGIAGIIITNLINVRLVPRLGSTRMLTTGARFGAIAGVVMAFTSLTDIGGVWGLVLPLFVFVGMSGFMIANSISGALTHFPDRAGSVSALVGAIHYSGGIAGTLLIGAFANGTPWPMGIVIGVAGVGSFLCTRYLPERT